MGDIEQGRIVWLTKVIDTQGNLTVDHRAVILTTSDDHEAGRPIEAAHISSKLNYTSADYMVNLPFARKRGGHPQTGCNVPSAVICNWLNENVKEENITSHHNLIYGAMLVEILEKVAEYKST